MHNDDGHDFPNISLLPCYTFNASARFAIWTSKSKPLTEVQMLLNPLMRVDYFNKIWMQKKH